MARERPLIRGGAGYPGGGVSAVKGRQTGKAEMGFGVGPTT